MNFCDGYFQCLNVFECIGRIFLIAYQRVFLNFRSLLMINESIFYVCSCFVLQNSIACMGLEMLLIRCFLLKWILWFGLDVTTNVISMCAI